MKINRSHIWENISCFIQLSVKRWVVWQYPLWSISTVEAYTGPCQTSMIELFAKTANSFWLWIIFDHILIIDLSQSPNMPAGKTDQKNIIYGHFHAVYRSTFFLSGIPCSRQTFINCKGLLFIQNTLYSPRFRKIDRQFRQKTVHSGAGVVTVHSGAAVISKQLFYRTRVNNCFSFSWGILLLEYPWNNLCNWLRRSWYKLC